ncbi:MAG: PstS family phosphate ABC transporter substrate-binding protein [Symploca sp. SIO3E6]|nr:PstS family phosphate ABC transporter substrate-binding protein [Caldora sp. SIO3E6]
MVVKNMQFKLNRVGIMGAIATVAATLAVAVPVVHSEDRTVIKIDGSSTVYPITEAVAEEFQKETRGNVRVTVGISGTGGGFKKFCNGETHISDASRPIKDSEKEKCAKEGIKYIELPVAYDALTVVVNKDNDWADSMTVEDLKKMWDSTAKGKIKKWNQVNPDWPNKNLKLYGPGSDSGTFDYFNEAIIGKEGSSRPDYTASEDDNVLVQGVSQTKGAIGYFGFAYYEANKNKLKAVKIDGGDGPVAPSSTTVNDGSYTPLSRPVFIYVNTEAAKEVGPLKQFVEFYLKNAPEYVDEVKYVPLPEADYEDGMKRFDDATK